MGIVLLAVALLALPAGIALGLSGSVTPAMAAHAALMVTAWGVMIPAGGVAARYFKVMPGQDFPRVFGDLTWWRWHRGLQYAAMVLSTAGLGVIVLQVGDDGFGTLHGRCGLAVMVLGWMQVVSAWLRGTKGGPTEAGADPRRPATWRGDHYDMMPRRLAFEAWHKPMGWLVMALAALTMLLGVDLVGDPAWLLFLVGGLQAGACLAVVDGVARRRWVDTYASLWGHGPPRPRRASAIGDGGPECIQGVVSPMRDGDAPVPEP